MFSYMQCLSHAGKHSVYLHLWGIPLQAHGLYSAAVGEHAAGADKWGTCLCRHTCLVSI